MLNSLLYFFSNVFAFAFVFKKKNKFHVVFYRFHVLHVTKRILLKIQIATIKNNYLWLRCIGVLDRTSGKMPPFLFNLSKNERHVFNPL